MRSLAFLAAIALFAGLLGGCVTDAATRLAYDLEAAAGRLGPSEGARYRLEHRVPSKSGECAGPYRVQMDKVGAIIIWCMDAAGDKTVSSHSTSYHRRFVVTPQTYIVEKPARDALIIDLQRSAGQIVIVGVQ